MANPTILLVEDTLPLASIYKEYLSDEKLELVHVATGGEAFDYLEEGRPEVILLDMQLPDMDGMQILEHISDKKIETSVVVITAHGSISRAVDAMRLGAFEFLLKPFDKSRLVFTVRNALERVRLKKVVYSYQSQFEDRKEFCNMLGSSLAMQSVYRTIENVASSKATVFITGESGTGKELAAHAIHELSPRRNQEFVVLNCGAIPKDLMESEIFGHVKGAFTGAIDNREGAAHKADGGTLFLDEIGEMDMDLQAKLLRFIQSGTFQKVGSTTTHKVDIRFVCATNRDPLKMVETGLFREDLYYRLNVVPIHMPPLRERGRDKLEIAYALLDNFTREEGKHFVRFSPEVEKVFLHHPWPGNVRQMQNIIRNVVVLHNGEEVSLEMLPAPFNSYDVTTPSATVVEKVAQTGDNVVVLPKMSPKAIRPLEEQEREIIEEAIRLCDGNITKAAGYLEINPSTIYRKMKSWRGPLLS
ncbi:sigma-54-dependent transcriptional regulator [Emcibacter nanhaiensis]|uniref:Sigma-54-dependent Fis family transcriptional regulator n=1 Tax=Emcibacter nanhaiensis TaxID=1505037 RepID=A0A501PGP5_9PROT|nr:sigma-54 dependent transcriptional regulator [Emcibacter nanhaiensis]TPD59375.1 sigma-54-dependent Fis family transcriptional regulator [Emcibacter nanhaiensis]